MQGGGSEASSMTTSTNSLGWSVTNPAQLQAQVDGVPASSSATSLQNTTPSSQAAGSTAWLQDMRPGLTGSQASGWEQQPTTHSNSVIGLNIPAAETNDSKETSDLSHGSAINKWGEKPAGSGWGDQQAKSTGWGEADPVAHAGTECWTQPAKPTTQGWNVQPPSSRPSSWGDQPDPKAPASSGWGQPQGKPEAPSWGGASNPATSAPSWGSAPPADDKPATTWGAPGEKGQQWGSGSTTQQWDASGSANPQSTSTTGVWGSSGPKPIGTQPPTNPANPSGAAPPQGASWAEMARQRLPPSTVPSKMPPAQMTNTMATVGMPGRGTTKDDVIAQAVNSNDGWGKLPVRQDTAWDHEEERPPPVKPPTAQQPPPPPPPPPPQQHHQPEESANTWTTSRNNTGTAIWEGTKEPSTSKMWGAGNPVPPGAGSGVSSGNEWNSSHSSSGSDTDLGTWNGATSDSSWNRPTDPNQWGAAGTASNGNNWAGGTGRPPSRATNSWSSSPSESNQWQEEKPAHSGNMWGTDPKQDNVWDRNGTQAWQTDTRRPAVQSQAPATAPPPQQPDTRTWHQQPPPQPPPVVNRQMSTGSWDGADRPAWEDEKKAGTAPRGSIDNGTSAWGDPVSQQKSLQTWSGPGTPTTPVGPPPPAGRGPGSGDERSAMWGGGQPEKPNQWGEDDSSIWNPQQASMNKPPAWGADNQWQKPRSGPGVPGWGDQQDWKKTGNMPPVPMGGQLRSGQMRSQVLQHLMDMGFKKEEAQDALISAQMNMNEAMAILMSRRSGVEPGENKGRIIRSGGADDLGEQRPANGQIMNPVQNTHINPPTQVPNAIKPGQQLPPNIVGSQASINQSIPGMVMPPKRPSIPQSVPTTPTPVPTTPQIMQQQQHIVQQLHMAVHAGLISPQLLNQQLTPNILIMLQHLLQLQQVQQQLVTQQQQFLQQKGRMNPLQQQQKLEQVAQAMQQVRQQITQQQKKINIAQQALPIIKQQQPTPPAVSVPSSVAPPAVSTPKDALADSMKVLSIKSESRLTSWTTKDVQASSSDDPKAVGSNKPMQASPGLPPIEGMPFPDSQVWSNSGLPSSQSSSWPTTGISSTTSASSKDEGESTGTATPPAEGINIPIATSGSSVSIASSADSTASSASSGSGSGVIDQIEEFIPGKPWQGAVPKNPEDDPYITPGSVARQASLSVNTIKGDSLATLSSKNPNSSPTVQGEAFQDWPLGSSLQKSSSSQSLLAGDKQSGWPTSGEESTSSIAQELWKVSSGAKNTRPPPGIHTSTSGWQQPGGINRSVSWAPGDGSTSNMASASLRGSTAWLTVKNLPPSIDSNTLKNLCMQHGSVQAFHHARGQSIALVGYGSKTDAAKAQQALLSCQLQAEMASDSEVARLLEQNRASSASTSAASAGVWPQSTAPPRSAPFSRSDASSWGTTSSSSSGVWGGDSSLWAPNTVEDRASAFLPGGLLSGH